MNLRTRNAIIAACLAVSIVGIYDIAIDNGRDYIVMEYAPAGRWTP